MVPCSAESPIVPTVSRPRGVGGVLLGSTDLRPASMMIRVGVGRLVTWTISDSPGLTLAAMVRYQRSPQIPPPASISVIPATPEEARYVPVPPAETISHGIP